MKAWTTLGLFLLMCGSLAMAACGDSGGKKGNGSSSGNSSSGGDKVTRKTVPDEIKDKKPPKPLSDPDLIAKGKELFHAVDKANCVQCHGEGGKGDGIAGKDLDPKPADLTSAEFQDAVSDAYIFWRITEPVKSKADQKSGMLGYPAGSDEDHWALTAYVRSLKGK